MTFCTHCHTDVARPCATVSAMMSCKPLRLDMITTCAMKAACRQKYESVCKVCVEPPICVRGALLTVENYLKQ
jgi:hypothetical protein